MRTIVEIEILCHSAPVEEREKAKDMGIPLEEEDLWLKMAINFKKVIAVKEDYGYPDQCVLTLRNVQIVARLPYVQAVEIMKSI